MERYKVYYWQGPDDYAVIYANTEEQAIDVFKKYNPHRDVLKVKPYPKLPSLRKLYRDSDVADEHEYLIAIIEAVSDLGFEEKVVERLQEMGIGR